MVSRPPVLLSTKLRFAFRLLVVLALCGAWAGADLAFGSAQTPERQFLSMLGLLAWLLAFLIGILCWRRDWRQVRYCALIAPLLCLGSCAGVTGIGTAVRRSQFERQLPRYQALVDQMEAGSIPVSLSSRAIALPESDRDLAYGVLAQKDTNGLVTVEFMTGCGFPVIHSGYLYVSSGAVQPGSVFDSRWPVKTPIKQKWFRISD